MTKQSSKSSSDDLLGPGFELLKAVSEDYVASSRELLEAAGLVDDDEIKIQMITHLHGEFEKIRARDEGMRAIVEREYERDFIIQEMMAISQMNRDLAQKITERLGSLPRRTRDEDVKS